MKPAIICYDLKNVKPNDNIIVKAKLAEYTNTLFTHSCLNEFSPLPEWVTLNLPDTTLLASVPDNTDAKILGAEIIKIIRSVGAEAEKVYIAFIDPSNDFLFNIP